MHVKVVLVTLAATSQAPTSQAESGSSLDLNSVRRHNRRSLAFSKRRLDGLPSEPPEAPSPNAPFSPPQPPIPVQWLEERAALVAMYEATGGASWRVRTNWLDGYPCTHSWQGVRCYASGGLAGKNETDGRVERLVMGSNGMCGTLPSNLDDLRFLTELLVYDNQISGSLPSSLLATAPIKKIDMTSNQISGWLGAAFTPASGQATHVLLSANRLSGTIPPSTVGSGMPLLRMLHLNGNPLSGTLPPWSPSVSQSLEVLQASSTSLEGTLPTELGALPRLQHLLADKTALSGFIPSELGRCGDLAMVSLEFNQLSGTIPLQLGGNCSRARDYILGPLVGSRPMLDTHLTEPVSDPTDGPRSHQHTDTRPHERRTSASLHFRGNHLSVSEQSVPVDLPDLSSNDVCAFGAGQVEVSVGPIGETRTTAWIQGNLLDPPSARSDRPPDGIY
mgnify:CR=1 FL=1|jgi:hypothetical protein